MRLLKYPGFTLIELMFSVATVAVLATISVPGLNSMLQENAAEALLNDLARTMNKARASAVFQGQTVTMCRSKDKQGCNGNWHDGILVFLDPDGNHVLKSSDEILHITAGASLPGTLILRSFPNKQYLQFTAMGVINNQTGNFTWCPADKNPRLAQQLIFNITGRVRFAVDADGDGIKEGADGAPLSCS
ncbi:MAG: GspH/FimT family pseudopilin [Pseudomonadota bacterium]